MGGDWVGCGDFWNSSKVLGYPILEGFMITYPRLKNDSDLFKSITGARRIQSKKHEMDRSISRQEVVIMDKVTPILTIRFDGAIEEISPVTFKQPMRSIVAEGIYADIPFNNPFLQQSMKDRLTFARMVK